MPITSSSTVPSGSTRSTFSPENIAEQICDAYNWENFDDVAQLCSVYPMTRLLSISVASVGCLPDVQPILVPAYDMSYVYDTICNELDVQGASPEQIESITLDDCRHSGSVSLHGLYSLSWEYIFASELI